MPISRSAIVAGALLFPGAATGLVGGHSAIAVIGGGAGRPPAGAGRTRPGDRRVRFATAELIWLFYRKFCRWDRRMVRSVLASVVLLFAGLAAAAEAADKRDPMIGRLVPAGCRQGLCQWFSLEEKTLVGSNAAGDLYRYVSKGYEARAAHGTYDPKAQRFNGNVSTQYAFCSPTRPATIFRGGLEAKRWVVHTLAPGTRAGLFAYNAGDYSEYFAVCHALTIKDVRKDGIAAGKRLGYKASPKMVGQSEVDEPEDLLRP
jgi:hypothetical protein